MTHLKIKCANEFATAQLAETLALALRPGHLITLDGDLGSGKTTLARALIRAASNDPTLEVPSPTFTLVQSYDKLPFGNLTHMDLYRLEEGVELEELGLEEAMNDGVVVIEWPQKAQGFLPAASLEIKILQGDSDDQRIFEISGTQNSLALVTRSLAIRKFLDENGHKDSTRVHLTGDASSRAYETIHPKTSGGDVILMNAPPMPDGDPIKDGKPYSQIAKLAEDMRPFVGVALALEKHGFRPPHIYAHDMDQGYLLIENLGTDEIVTVDREPIAPRYKAAVETIAKLHEKTWNPQCEMPSGDPHIIPPFDREAILIEVDLLPSWYAPHKLGKALNQDDLTRFYEIWNGLIDRLEKAEKSLTLRDYHSPNVIWIENAKGSDRTGLIDFQDALIGPTAYDVASLAQDARVDVSAELETALVDHYCSIRTGFDEEQFREAYAIMAAERATKVLGIFVRLSERDGKHGYLNHLPRIEDYLSRSLAHPVLAEYRAWVETVIK